MNFRGRYTLHGSSRDSAEFHGIVTFTLAPTIPVEIELAASFSQGLKRGRPCSSGENLSPIGEANQEISPIIDFPTPVVYLGTAEWGLLA